MYVYWIIDIWDGAAANMFIMYVDRQVNALLSDLSKFTCLSVTIMCMYKSYEMAGIESFGNIDDAA